MEKLISNGLSSFGEVPRIVRMGTQRALEISILKYKEFLIRYQKITKESPERLGFA